MIFKTGGDFSPPVLCVAYRWPRTPDAAPGRSTGKKGFRMNSHKVRIQRTWENDDGFSSDYVVSKLPLVFTCPDCGLSISWIKSDLYPAPYECSCGSVFSIKLSDIRKVPKYMILPSSKNVFAFVVTRHKYYDISLPTARDEEAR